VVSTVDEFGLEVELYGEERKAIIMQQVQYISDEQHRITGVIVPIELWRELQAEKEITYLLKSATMK
jgi:hypothetical protein